MSDETNNAVDTPSDSTTQATDTQPEKRAGEKTFTQSELERLLDDRLKRDRNAQESKLLETLGFDNLDDLKSLVEAKRQSDEAQMTELDKAKAEIEKANKKAQDAEKLLADMRQQQIVDGRKNAFISAIRSKGAKDESRLQILVQAEMPDAFDKVFEDDSAIVNEKLMESFIKDVQGKFPLYFGSAGAGSPSTANGVSINSANASEEAKRMTKRYGKL